MAGVTASVALSIDATEFGTGALGTPKQRVSISKALDFLAGTDAVNKLDVMYQATRTLAASANEDLDLAGVLVDAFGATIAAGEVVVLFIAAAPGNTNNVKVGPASANGFSGPFADPTDRLTVKPGEWVNMVSQSGWAVVAATGDKLNVANSGAGTGVTYDILVLGRTVAA